jgi:hydroxypyruvate isomerase
MFHRTFSTRREFIAATAVAAALPAVGHAQETSRMIHPFTMKFAPHFGMFADLAGPDPIDQIHFMHEMGFRAIEDNGMARRGVDLQKRIGATLEQLDMQMGVFVASADFSRVDFADSSKSMREELVAKMRNAVEVSKRVNATWTTVVPGKVNPGVELDYQTVNVIENLKWCAEVCEPAGLIMVLEPLNPWADHPGLFLTKMPQAYLVCKAVGSPSCKILDDLYHQQITEGNLIPNLDKCWDEIAYFQVGDNPGRQEPGTGEINYANVFQHIYDKGFRGVVGMEHGVSGGGKAGEEALIQAYQDVDPA